MSIKDESKRASDNSLRPKVLGDRIWCPFCSDYAHFLKSASAAELLTVSQRTVYRWIQEGIVYSFKAAGKSYRVCSSCLLKRAQ